MKRSVSFWTACCLLGAFVTDEAAQRLVVDSRACLEHLTLSSRNREQIALWTGGRRFLLVPFGNALIVDLEGVPALLSRLFVGVSHEQAKRGTIFERAFVNALVAEGFEVPKIGEIVAESGEVREIDASVRVGEELLLFECRSMEQPLDFEIGRPRTMTERQRRFTSKVEQVLKLRDFLVANPTGRNYDFSWAREVRVAFFCKA